MSVSIGEQATLEHLVRRGAYARHEVSRVEGCLLDVREVVVRIPIEHELADLDKWVVGVRPHLREVERVDAEATSLGGGHHLNLERPRGVVTALDCFEQIAVVGLGVRTRERRRFLGRECRDALISLEVVLDVELLILGIGPGEGVRAEAVHLPVVGRNATVTEQPREHVRRLGRM